MNILLKSFLLNNYISRLHKIENGIMEGKDQRIKELEKLVEEQKKVLGKTHKVFLRGTCGTTEVEINVKNKSVTVNSEDKSTEVGLLCDNTEPIRDGDIFMCPNPEGKDQFLEK